MRLHRILILVFLYTAFLTYGQWNVQTGYNFGFFSTDYNGGELLDRKENTYHLHRVNLNGAYEFKNNLFASMTTGVDIYDVKHDLVIIDDVVSDGNTFEEQRRSIHSSIIQNFKIGVSVGYKVRLNAKSSTFFSIGFNQFFVNEVNIKRSKYSEKYYSESDEDTPFQSKKEQRTMIDLEEIGHRNKLSRHNQLFIFSLGYRYEFDNRFIGCSVGFSPRNRSLVRPIFLIPEPQNLFLFGINLGYTFPQKDQNDEE